jgi:hypothetical protein
MISELYLHSGSLARPLRIGVILDAFQIPNVLCRVLADIRSSDFARLELVIVNRHAQSPPAPPHAGLLDRSFLYSRFRKYDQRRIKQPNPLKIVDCADFLTGCPSLEVSPLAERPANRFPPDAMAALQNRDLDVILQFGSTSLPGEVLSSARYGVWSFHFGDSEFYRGDPPLFWEVFEDNPCSGVSLQVLAGNPDENLTLCKSVFPTARGYWPARNLFQPYWGSAHFVIRKLHQLHEQGWESVKQQAIPPAPYRGKTAAYRTPGNFQMLKWLIPLAWEELDLRLDPWRVNKTDQWRICVRRSNSPGLLTGSSHDKSGFRWMPCPSGHYYADPVLFENQGQMWVFFEDYIYQERRGRICCAPILADGSFGDSSVCLDLPYHLSYPIVFRHEGEIFMMPESVANGCVALWRATEFPFTWKLEKKLFNGLLVDTTPVLHEERWYFFTALLARLNTHAAFGALFSADSLTGDWVRHPGCPISTDVRDARSAGPILEADNRLLRPVQDCSENYGRRIYVEEILELTPTIYRARRLHSIESDWEKDLRGVHTYGYCAGFEVLDAVRRRDRRMA